MLVQHLPIQRWLVTVPIFLFCEVIHADFVHDVTDTDYWEQNGSMELKNCGFHQTAPNTE